MKEKRIIHTNLSNCIFPFLLNTYTSVNMSKMIVYYTVRLTTLRLLHAPLKITPMLDFVDDRANATFFMTLKDGALVA